LNQAVKVSQTFMGSQQKVRLESIDLLRGLLMLLMAIDHARDFFTSVSGFDPTDSLQSWPALFATRWVTHLCAPGFIALAGASVYLQKQRGKSNGAITRLLITRGLWLILLEVTIVSYGWSFALGPALQVIWAIGISMIFLALVHRLPVVMVGLIGAVIVVTHNLFDSVRAASFGSAAIVWQLLHQQGPIFAHGRMVGFVLYPLVPWIGVICLGYAFGSIAVMTPARRQRIAVSTGISFLAVFTLLRVFHGYGDRIPFQVQPTPIRTLMSLFQVAKYPPSLHYLLSTLGIVLLLYTLFDLAATRGWLPRLRGVIETYGRVPFFYYVLHIYLIHLGALLLSAEEGLDWRHWLIPGAVFFDHLPGWGFNLGGVYLAWFLAVALLYFPCLWFSRLKARRRDWWLSYL
jgi:uncharacterized membrane protein